MEVLAATLNEDDFQYITDQAEYERGLEVYNNKIRQEGIDYAVREYESRFLLTDDIKKLAHEKQKLEEATQKVKQEKQKIEYSLKQGIRRFLKYGDSVEDIAELLEIDMLTLARFLAQIITESEAAKPKK